MVRPLFAAALALALMCPLTAGATILSYGTPLGLTGDQEVPVRITPGNGWASAHYDTTTLLLEVHMEWADLLAPAQAAHIHVAATPGTNGPVAVDFVPAGIPNTTSGVFHHTFDLASAASYGGTFLTSFGGDVNAARAAVLAGLADNRAYFNIHTSVYPPGEIRGNISVVPEPTSMALVGVGLAMAALRRRRRQG